MEDLEGAWREKKGILEEDMRAAREQAEGLKQETAGVRGWGVQPLQDSYAAHHALQLQLEDATRCACQCSISHVHRCMHHLSSQVGGYW